MSEIAGVTFRQGMEDDSYTVFLLFEHALADLLKRFGSQEETSLADPEALARMWERRRPLYEHLTRTADQYWIAENDGEAVGFARSIVRDGVQQLTELFVKPGVRLSGLGRALITRALPPVDARRQVIVASPDTPALALYLKQGVYPRFPVYYFGRAPEIVSYSSTLDIEPTAASSETLDALNTLDEAIIGYRRQVDHEWLLSDRQGYLYRRDGQPIGYGYVGVQSGPFALLKADDFPPVLSHAEAEAARAGYDHFGLEVPLINRTAVDHLLGRGFRMDWFVAQFMSDTPFGQYEQYILPSPPFFP